jgi:hypothetical protein
LTSKASSDKIIVFDAQGRPVNGDPTPTTEAPEVPRRAPPSRVRITRPPADVDETDEVRYITSSRLTKDGE